MPIVVIQNQQTHVPIPIPIPDITPLNPPLGVIPPIPLNFERINDTAKYSPIRAAIIGMTKAARSAEAVTATGSLNVARYGAVLKRAGWSACAESGDSLRRALLRQERDEQNQARRIQTGFHPHAATASFPPFRKCPYER